MDPLISNLEAMDVNSDSPSVSQRVVELDGTYLEGGGQLLRTAVCLSALTGTPVRITDIRGKRKGGGGLKAQHLASVKWLAKACSARVAGAEIGSKEFLFEPNQENANEEIHKRKRDEEGNKFYEANIEVGTAGSTGLVLQAVLPFILFSDRMPVDLPIHLTLRGGTNVSGSPSYEYISQVLLPTLRDIGLPEMKARLIRRGWSTGSRDAGCLKLEIPARKDSRRLLAFDMVRELSPDAPLKPIKLTATFIAPVETHRHFEKILQAAVQHHFGVSSDNVEITCEDTGHNQKRLYFILIASLPVSNSSSPHILATDFLYERKAAINNSTVTSITESVVRNLHKEWQSEGRVDEHMFDQLVIFRALAEGKCQVFPGFGEGSFEDGERVWREPTDHTRTAQWVCERMLGVRFDGKGRCDGIGRGEGGED